MPLLASKPGKGLLFIVSAPAGAGKTTLVQLLTNEFSSIVANISYTTRQPRENEVHGKHYYFITEHEFNKKILAADFLEYVRLYDDYYGTSKEWILGQQSLGKHVVLVIDTQGALKLKKELNAVSIFISPPSFEILKKRLLTRNTESLAVVEKRLRWAKKEMEAMGEYDYLIVNDELQTAYQILRSIIIAENHRIVSKMTE